ncbi:alpha/beta fold hydrolase [Mycoplasma miroungirhinis]|uniref:Alpha/beta hydrolase n=1 Tax=Mycoplasma miroungirhinis TaxID=754516 RepID=A0A6M4JCR0_9MOLU|nr:alpha/beta hydrolase [Mycoplasma miroungirhinis]QJR44135.1 alpha/beta hydrolase [Mycoplasma miroungirhinis]
MINYKYPYIFIDNKKQEQPIIFVHGFNSNCERFNTFAQNWKENDYYAISFPGNNNLKPLDNDEVSVESFSNILIKFIDDNNLKNVILVGHSMGGGIISLAYKKRPELFSKMIYIAPMNKTSLAKLDSYLDTYFPKTFQEYLKFLSVLYYDISEFTNNLDWMKQKEQLFDPHDYNNETIVKLGNSLPNLELMNKIEAGLNAINVPTLLILGEKDGVIDRDTCLQYFKDNVKNVKTTYIPKTGHMMYEENFEEFMKIVTPFLREK